MDRIKIAIADDQALFRKGMFAILGDTPEFDLTFEAENGQDLIEKIKTDQPDIVLMDLEMPVMTGMQATQYIREHYPDIRVLVLSMHSEDSFIIHMIELGANGYLLKNAEPEEVEEAIFTVMANNYYFNERVSTAMLKGLMNKQNIKPSFHSGVHLNDQEIRILKLICNENTSVEIGDIIHKSSRTVEGYRKKIMEKVGAKNTAGLVMYAIKAGYVSV